MAEVCAFCGRRCLSATCTAGSILDVFCFLGHDPAFVQSSEFFLPFTAQPHCISAMHKSYLILVMHCISCSHCMSNQTCCCGKPSIGLTLEQRPRLSPGALQLCTASSTAQCDHAHAVHTALREFAESCGKFAEIVRKIAGSFSTAPAKGAESGGKSRRLAESRGKSRKWAERGRITTCSSGRTWQSAQTHPAPAQMVFHFCRRLCCTCARHSCK